MRSNLMRMTMPWRVWGLWFTVDAFIRYSYHPTTSYYFSLCEQYYRSNNFSPRSKFLGRIKVSLSGKPASSCQPACIMLNTQTAPQSWVSHITVYQLHQRQWLQVHIPMQASWGLKPIHRWDEKLYSGLFWLPGWWSNRLQHQTNSAMNIFGIWVLMTI